MEQAGRKDFAMILLNDQMVARNGISVPKKAAIALSAYSRGMRQLTSTAPASPAFWIQSANCCNCNELISPFTLSLSSYTHFMFYLFRRSLIRICARMNRRIPFGCTVPAHPQLFDDRAK
jgi:hypothetical protein